jgi:16S rRNA (cytosine1402-N4)-methyltransferase
MRMVNEQDLGPVQGIVLDLGFSSLQLDVPERGFSFQNPGPLDMRYDRAQQLTAAVVVNKYQEQELSDLFKKYGEEPHAKKIARALVVRRKSADLHSADEVYNIIKQALPAPVRHKAADSARRIFQALRIEVNGELNNLSHALPQMFEGLTAGGRLVVISFHSLEDRIVKNFFTDMAKGCICPPEFPECVCGNKPKGRILTKKPVTAQPQELAENPRSKPAKLRAIQKLN